MVRKLKRRKRLCQCGCGEEIKQNRDGQWNKFVNHHNSRMFSPELKKQIGNSLKGNSHGIKD